MSSPQIRTPKFRARLRPAHQFSVEIEEPLTKRLKLESVDTPEKLENPENYILSKFNDSEFSDITVVVVEDEDLKLYYLHRIMLCSKSGYFKSAFKPGCFEESKSQYVHLPHITSETFDIVGKWIYGCAYKLPCPCNVDSVIKVHEAADYLQMQPLKDEILEQLYKAFTEPRRELSPYMETQLLQNLCRKSRISDWSMLRKCIAPMLKTHPISPKALVSLARGDQDDLFFYAICLDICQPSFSSKTIGVTGKHL